MEAQERRSPALVPAQAAEYLQVQVSTLSKWRVHGIGPDFTRAGRLIRYRLQDLDDYLVKNLRQSTSATHSAVRGKF